MEFWQGFARRVAEFCYRIWPSSSPRSAILESVAFWGPGVGGTPPEPGKSTSYMKLLLEIEHIQPPGVFQNSGRPLGLGKRGHQTL